MSNLLDYLRWRGDLTLCQSPVNEVDALVFTQLTMLNFHGIVSESGESVSLSHAADRFFALGRDREDLGALIPNTSVQLLALCAKSPRFHNARLSFFADRLSEERQEQFSAITADLTDGSTLLAFRGTDDTIVGWREDFNLIWQFPVPAQTDALKYLEQVALQRPASPLRLCGHSKGGNLAVYAAVFAGSRIQRKILDVYSFDGPGFCRRLQELREYDRVAGRIHSIVPQSSLVGMLLEHSEDYDVVQSNQNGLMQHDAFSWEVLGPSLVYLNHVTDHCAYVDRSLKEWVDSMDDTQREKLVDQVFSLLAGTGAKTLTELNNDKLGLLRKILEALNTIDPEIRDKLHQIMRMLIPPLQLPRWSS